MSFSRITTLESAITTRMRLLVYHEFKMQDQRVSVQCGHAHASLHRPTSASQISPTPSGKNSCQFLGLSSTSAPVRPCVCAPAELHGQTLAFCSDCSRTQEGQPKAHPRATAMALWVPWGSCAASGRASPFAGRRARRTKQKQVSLWSPGC